MPRTKAVCTTAAFMRSSADLELCEKVRRSVIWWTGSLDDIVGSVSRSGVRVDLAAEVCFRSGGFPECSMPARL